MTGAATIMITHDLGVVKPGVADDILVMYAGKPVEIAKAEDLGTSILLPPVHHRSAAVPRVTVPKVSLVLIEGTPPNLINPQCSSARVAPSLRAVASAARTQRRARSAAAGRRWRGPLLRTISSDLVGKTAEELYPVPEPPVSKYDGIPRGAPPS